VIASDDFIGELARACSLFFFSPVRLLPDCRLKVPSIWQNLIAFEPGLLPPLLGAGLLVRILPVQHLLGQVAPEENNRKRIFLHVALALGTLRAFRTRRDATWRFSRVKIYCSCNSGRGSSAHFRIFCLIFVCEYGAADDFQRK